MSWRTALLAVYIGLPLACCIAWGGWAWFAFFAVWALVWFGFAVFWDRAQRARRALQQRPTSS